MNHVRNLWKRLRSTYFLPCRLDEYRELITTGLKCGYEFHSILSFWRLLQDKGYDSSSRYIIMRHDVDIDVKTAAKMWAIERELGVKSSFYFRLNTINFDLMRQIENSGFEASYHYEELATYAKKYRIKDPGALRELLPKIRRLFSNNLKRLRDSSGLPMVSVASHGDFANRKLGLTNTIILNCNKLRKEIGIEVEAYDERLMALVTSRYSDTGYPSWWKPNHPFDAIQRKDQVIYILTHPGRWHRNFAARFKEDFVRAKQGLHYR